MLQTTDIPILGLDFLGANSSVIDCGRKLLTFPSREIFFSLTDVPVRVDTGSIGLITNRSITVPAASEIEIMIKARSPVAEGMWIVEGDLVRRHGVMVANAIVHPCCSALIPVRLLNPRDTPVTVKKGKQIAKMELAESCTTTTSISAISVDTELSSKDEQALWDLVLKVGNHISAAEKEQLFSVLVEYKDTFALHELG